jgi:hypothetical protein
MLWVDHYCSNAIVPTGERFILLMSYEANDV